MGKYWVILEQGGTFGPYDTTDEALTAFQDRLNSNKKVYNTRIYLMQVTHEITVEVTAKPVLTPKVETKVIPSFADFGESRNPYRTGDF